MKELEDESLLDCATGLDQTFSYQIDIVIPNLESSFADLKDHFLSQHVYFLLSGIKLVELIEPKFIATFFDKSNKSGRLYLLSFSTLLDCHDCVCLQPNGLLTLNVTKATDERIPLNHSKTTDKKQGYDKYEITLNVNDQKVIKQEALREAFSRMEFSFYCCWINSNAATSAEADLKNYFGRDRVHRCLNRITTEIITSVESVSNLLESLDPSYDHQLELIEICLGCLFNRINPESVLTANDLVIHRKMSKTTTTSILRIKGFLPNQLIESVIIESVKSILHCLMNLDDEEHQSTRRVFIKAHGFIDSPVFLCKLRKHSFKFNNKLRVCRSNHLNIILDAKRDKKTQIDFTNRFIWHQDFILTNQNIINHE